MEYTWVFKTESSLQSKNFGWYSILSYLSIQVLAEIAVSNLCHHWAFLLCSVFNNNIKAYWLSVTDYWQLDFLVFLFIMYNVLKYSDSPS